MIRTIKENGINGLTIFSCFSGLVDALANFLKIRISMAGLTETLSIIRNFMTDEYGRIPSQHNQ